MRTVTALIGINKTTAAYYFRRLRLLIYLHSEHLGMFKGENKVYESNFSGRCKGKLGSGALGKSISV